jgi:hypothetical protein
MAENVVPFSVVEKPEVELNEYQLNLVEKLEYLMAGVRSGDIRGVGFVAVTKTTEVSVSWGGDADSHFMISGASRLQFEMLSRQELK